MQELLKTETTTNALHLPVLLKETLEILELKDNGVYVDCTFGLGGHSRQILKKIIDGVLLAFEWDKKQIDFVFSESNFCLKPNFFLINDNFTTLPENLKRLKIGKIDGLLFDLGLSSFQLENTELGLSFRKDEELNMRISSKNSSLTAEQIINTFSADQLADIFFRFGEERYSKIIARKIIKRRKVKAIKTTQQLVGIIASCFTTKNKKHPARKVFQALRIFINDEINNLSIALKNSFELMAIKGRIVVISYNSLEDRVVKRLFKEQVELKRFVAINKKPVTPSKEELSKNNRARSAKLRVIEKIVLD